MYSSIRGRADSQVKSFPYKNLCITSLCQKFADLRILSRVFTLFRNIFSFINNRSIETIDFVLIDVLF